MGLSITSRQNAETEWKSIFFEVFEGFELKHNFDIGRYRVDFFIKKLCVNFVQNF